ncbi:MAG: hypothetical protein ACQESA_03680 [Patescibacteria group bacterium]
MAKKNQPSKTDTGHGSSRPGKGGGTSFHNPFKGGSSKGSTKTGKTGNTKGGGSKRSKP